MVASNKIAGVIFVVVCLCLQASAQHYCFQQNCRECEASAVKSKGESVKCDVKSQVSTAWLNNTGFPIIDVNALNSTEFACIKMVSSKPKTDENGDSTDVIRGCSFKSLAQSTCDSLIRLQEQRSKKTVCVICEGNECNGSSSVSGSIITLLATAVLAKIINY